MKMIVNIVSVLCVLTIVACSSSNSDTGEQNTVEGTFPSLRTIVSEEDFVDTIVGKTMVLRDQDGNRDPTSQLVVNANMKVTGFNENGEIDLDWYWDNDAYCRSGVSNLPDNPRTVELECQSVRVDGSVADFIRDRGAGELASSWFIE